MYLLTGAAGFMGGTICRKLIERGDKVRAFVLPGDKAISFVPKEAGIIHVPERKFKVICEEGYIENNKLVITSTQRGALKIDDTHLIFKPIYLNIGDHSPRTYEVADVKSVKRGPLTHLYIYLTDNRVIRLNTTSKKPITNILSK